jgi:hypothetical protein
LCLGYKANVVKEFFLNHKPQTYADCIVSGFGGSVASSAIRSGTGGAWSTPDLAQYRPAAVGHASTAQARRCSLPATATACDVNLTK